MTNPKIDCIELKRQVQGQVYEEIKDLSRQEQLEYFRKYVNGTSPLAEKFRRLQTTPSVSSNRPTKPS